MYTKTILHWLWEVLDDLIGHSYFSDLKNKQHICSRANRWECQRQGKKSKYLKTPEFPSQCISSEFEFSTSCCFHTFSHSVMYFLLCLPRRNQRKVKANLKCINNAVVSESSLQVPMLQFGKHRNLGVHPAVNFTDGSSLWKGSAQKSLNASTPNFANIHVLQFRCTSTRNAIVCLAIKTLISLYWHD